MGRRRRCRAALAALGIAFVAPPVSAQWLLWSSPLEGREVLDQSQLHESTEFLRVGPTRPVGQTFVPRRGTLYRMDFQASNDLDPRPGRVRLWKWAGSVEATLGQPVLFEDRLGLRGSSAWQVVAFFPRIQVEIGATYFVELSAPDGNSFVLKASLDGADRYPDGQLWLGRKEADPSHDVWFRTYDVAGWTPEPQQLSTPGRPWSDPVALREAPSAQDYRNLVSDIATRVRTAHLQSCGRDSHKHVFHEAFLYHASCRDGSCDERYARNALEMFRLAHAWRFCSWLGTAHAASCSPRCGPDSPVSYDWKPALSFLWLRDSPSMSDAEQARIRELLGDAARRLWPRRQGGTSSRALQDAVFFLLACRLVPDAPDNAAWCRHAADVWDEFWTHVDTEEDSGPYFWASWWPQVLLYAAIGGLDDLVWGDPRFRELVERSVQLVAPLGVAPSWGDSSGWATDPSGLIWLLEKAAARYGEPEYRWLALQLLAYSQAHVRADRPDEPLYQGSPYLAMAWLDADESLEPAPPPERHELPAARHESPVRVGWQVGAGGTIGQTFRPTASPLVRLHVRARPLGNASAARLSLWRWKGSLEATRAEVPLFRSPLEMGGPDHFLTRSVFPFLDVEAGADYYLEVERAAPLELEGSPSGTDPYPGGTLWRNGRPEPADLRFATYALSTGGSSLTYRSRAQQRPKPEWKNVPRRSYELTNERIPDKLVLRSGSAPGDLLAAFNLVSGYRHGQAELGALVALMDEGSLLIGNGPFPYWFHSGRPQDESLPLVRRYWGGGSSEPGDHVEVTHFADSRSTTVVWLEWDDPGGWGVRQERRIYFVRNRFLLVRDRFTFSEAMSASVGPVWHVGDVSPTRGLHWFDVYDREPLSNIWKVRNPERYALLHFVPRPELEAKVRLEPSYLPPAECGASTNGVVQAKCRAGPPYVVYQRWLGEAEPSTTRWLDTLIVPHGPEVPPHLLASAVRILHDDGVALALELGLEDETWLVLDSPQRDPIDAGGVSTDARYAISRVAADAPDYARVEEASFFTWGRVQLQWGVPTSVELGGFAHRREPSASAP